MTLPAVRRTHWRQHPGRFRNRVGRRQRFLAADRDAPQAAIDRIRRALRRQRQFVLLEVGELFLAHPAVVAHGRQHLETGVQCPQRDLEAHLVIAGRRAAVGDRRRAALARDLCEFLRLQAAFGADTQRIGVAAQDIARNQVADDGLEELLLGIDQDVFDRAEGQRPLLERFGRLVIDAARIDAGRHDVAAVVLLEPGHAERRIQAAREGEDDG